jgi:hypothetical protein
MRIDRYGPHSGKFASPEGTPAAARSLPPGRASEPIRSFEVLKPLEVKEGLAAPAFGQPGMGTQYKLPDTVENLIRDGYLREVR